MKRFALLLLAALPACTIYAGPPPRRVVYVRDYPTSPAPPPSYDDWPAPSSGETTVVVESEPPPARYEVITESPGVDFVWVGGVWVWHDRWVWAPGHWTHGRPGYVYRPGVWVRGGRGWSYRGGGWHHR
jgi:hypothetical protein